MTAHHSRYQLFFWLKLAAFSVFFGRGLQHFLADTPYRAFFWDESIFQLKGNDWSYFANNLFSDQFIDYLAFGIGVYFIICSIIILRFFKYGDQNIKLKALPSRKLLFLGTFLLFLLALLYSKDHFFEVPQFLEYMRIKS